MSEDLNCYAKFVPPVEADPKKPKKPLQEDTRKNDGTYQTTGDWMRVGGKKPSIVV